MVEFQRKLVARVAMRRGNEVARVAMRRGNEVAKSSNEKGK